MLLNRYSSQTYALSRYIVSIYWNLRLKRAQRTQQLPKSEREAEAIVKANGVQHAESVPLISHWLHP